MRKLLATALTALALAVPGSASAVEYADNETAQQAWNAMWASSLMILNDWPDNVDTDPRGNLQKFGQGDWRVTYDSVYSGPYGSGTCSYRITVSRRGYTYIWTTCPQWTPPNTQ